MIQHKGKRDVMGKYGDMIICPTMFPTSIRRCRWRNGRPSFRPLPHWRVMGTLYGRRRGLRMRLSNWMRTDGITVSMGYIIQMECGLFWEEE